MKYAVIAAGLFVAAALLPSSARANGCINCLVQSKVASAESPGKFVFRVVCIELLSGDEIAMNITASTDEEALKIMDEAKCK